MSRTKFKCFNTDENVSHSKLLVASNKIHSCLWCVYMYEERTFHVSLSLFNVNAYGLLLSKYCYCQKIANLSFPQLTPPSPHPPIKEKEGFPSTLSNLNGDSFCSLA